MLKPEHKNMIDFCHLLENFTFIRSVHISIHIGGFVWILSIRVVHDVGVGIICIHLRIGF